MERTTDTTIPEFGSLEEERQYWEARGPLAEGRKGQVNRPRPGQKRSSFLAVRLTGEELTRLRDMAAQLGLGPSTFARLVLVSTLEDPQRWRKRVTLDQFDALARAATVGDPSSPALLIIDAAQMKQAEELILPVLRALLSMAGVQLITPKDDNYEKVRDAATAHR